MTTKKEKLNAQQAFNRFLFETMMDRIRGAELLGQDIQKLQGQINSLKVSDAATIGSFKSLFPRVERLEAYPQTGEEARRYWQVPDQRFIVVEEQNRKLNEKVEKLEGVLNFKLNHSKRIADLEETAEALSETVDQLSSVGPHTCHNIAALKDDRKRIMELEEIVEQLQISRSAEMLYHNDMIKRMDGLDNRLSRAQDMIAEMHKEGFIPVKQPQRKPMRSP